MAGGNTSILDLSKLPPPDVVETLDYEVILAERKARMKFLLDEAGILPDWNPDLESDPIVKLLEENAYRELLLRQRVNDSCRSVMLASAIGADLDQIGARFNVARLMLRPADPQAVPPTAPVMEDDDRLRMRIQLAFEGFSTAGPTGAYRFHTLSADAAVKDCSVTCPRPGDVLITVLASGGDGTPVPALLAIVAAALNDDHVRPLSDTVLVRAAQIVPYEIMATLEIAAGPDGDTVRAEALSQAQAYADAIHTVQGVVARSGIDGALHRPGVQRVIRTSPAADIVTSPTQAPYCTAITLVIADG